MGINQEETESKIPWEDRHDGGYSGNGKIYSNITEAEDYWINHCERFYKETGNLPRSWKELPEYIKTDRIKNYYLDLAKRKKNDEQASTKI